MVLANEATGALCVRQCTGHVKLKPFLISTGVYADADADVHAKTTRRAASRFFMTTLLNVQSNAD